MNTAGAGAKIEFFLGPGGVGKTTISIVEAVKRAQSGKKVAIISIDPSKKLADALNLDRNGGITSLFSDKLEKSDCGGVLDGLVLKNMSIFNDSIGKFFKSKGENKGEDPDKILTHPYFVMAMEYLSGIVEYAAIVKIHELYHSDKYDYVYVDTPPAANALNFFAKPIYINNFVNSPFFGWIVKSTTFSAGLTNLLISKTSVKAVFSKFLSKFLGNQSFDKFIEFMNLSYQYIHFLGKMSLELSAIWQNNAISRFNFILTPTYSNYRLLQFMASDLEEKHFKLNKVFLNRVLPMQEPLDPHLLESDQQAYENREAMQNTVYKNIQSDFFSHENAIQTYPDLFLEKWHPDTLWNVALAAGGEQGW